MKAFDTDAHVEEWQATFSERYLDATFAARRPVIVGTEDRAYWLIEDRVFPQLVGRGCHILGTPTGYGVVKRDITAGKPETIESLELRDPGARLKDMDREDLEVQVLYPTLFVAYPLTSDASFYAALCRAYNRWIADATAGASDRLKWVGVVSLADPLAAAAEVEQVHQLGGVGVMVLGTEGTRLLDDPLFEPFFAACEQRRMPIAVHVGWSCPPMNDLYDRVYGAAVAPFVFPVLMAFLSIVGGGVLDRHPQLKVGFFEAGVTWLPFWVERMDHMWEIARRLPWMGYKAERKPSEYLRSGNLFVTCEVSERLLPHVVDYLGEDQVLFASDMPHADREPYAAKILYERNDLSASVKEKILYRNGLRFYGL